MPKDPVCGRYVEKSTPYRQEYDGTLYYFCCIDCLDEFKHSISDEESILDESGDLADR